MWRRPGPGPGDETVWICNLISALPGLGRQVQQENKSDVSGCTNADVPADNSHSASPQADGDDRGPVEPASNLENNEPVAEAETETAETAETETAETEAEQDVQEKSASPPPQEQDEVACCSHFCLTRGEVSTTAEKSEEWFDLLFQEAEGEQREEDAASPAPDDEKVSEEETPPNEMPWNSPNKNSRGVLGGVCSQADPSLLI